MQNFDEKEISAALNRMSAELLEAASPQNLVILGVETAGQVLATRVQHRIYQETDCMVPVGQLSLNVYRQDRLRSEHFVNLNPSNIPVDLNDRDILLIDTVMNSGRNIQAALEAIMDHGHPSAVRTMVLIDTQRLVLPVQANFTGFTVPLSSDDEVDVQLLEIHGQDQVSCQAQVNAPVS